MQPRYVLDTNAFTCLMEGVIELEDLPAGEFIVTPLQIAELEATPDPAKRKRLFDAVDAVSPTQVEGESFCFDVAGAGFGQAKWTSGDSYSRLYSSLEKARPDKNNRVDALIAEVALKNGWSLVTNDRRLAESAERCGVAVINIQTMRP